MENAEDTMQEIKEEKKQEPYAVQDYLSLGYVFLLILGVLYQTIYYSFLGINILEYSSILDVLISPIAVLTGDYKLLFGILFCCLIAFLYAKLIPKYYTWLSKKKKYQSGKKKEKLDKIRKALKTGSKSLIIIMIALYILGGFVGFGFGRGGKTKKRIKNNDYEVSHQITFDDGISQNIKMLGKNSLYIFYITKENTEIIIAPIEGNIKTIKKLKEKK